jgi:hypothetical protein
MYKIYKYELELEDQQSLVLPGHSKILTVIEQNNKIVLYAQVTNSKYYDHYTIFVRGTGHSIGDSALYLNTVKIGIFVWHIFYKR